MKLLLDSNVLLWSLADLTRLTPRVRKLVEDDESEVFISHVSIWELSAKMVRGRLPILGSSMRPVLKQIDRLGFQLLPVELADILQVEALEPHHGDPFDRMIVAQALRRKLTILTADATIPLYPVPVIWR